MKLADFSMSDPDPLKHLNSIPTNDMTVIQVEIQVQDVLYQDYEDDLLTKGTHRHTQPLTGMVSSQKTVCILLCMCFCLFALA